jgi:hypothetical protein
MPSTKLFALLFVFALVGCAGGVAEYNGADAPRFAEPPCE